MRTMGVSEPSLHRESTDSLIHKDDLGSIQLEYTLLEVDVLNIVEFVEHSHAVHCTRPMVLCVCAEEHGDLQVQQLENCRQSLST